MSKILFAVDGSAHANKALDQWLTQQGPSAASHEVHLLSVQLPVDGNVRTFVNAEELSAYHRAEGEAALAAARQRLDAAGVRHQHHIVVGSPADTICRFAAEQRVDEIVMGTHGRTGLMELLMGSVATQVSAQAQAKVTLIK
jgi:nucleotide-binding universal stress UspA family protein